jgi:hypothetical protein
MNELMELLTVNEPLICCIPSRAAALPAAAAADFIRSATNRPSSAPIIISRNHSAEQQCAAINRLSYRSLSHYCPRVCL